MFQPVPFTQLITRAREVIAEYEAELADLDAHADEHSARRKARVELYLASWHDLLAVLEMQADDDSTAAPDAA